MASITFDTHKFIQTLQEAGFDQKQAEAVSKAFKEATGEGEFATKSDVEMVRQDMRELELKIETRFERIDGKMLLLQWMMGILIGGISALIIKAFFA